MTNIQKLIKEYVKEEKLEWTEQDSFENKGKLEKGNYLANILITFLQKLELAAEKDGIPKEVFTTIFCESIIGFGSKDDQERQQKINNLTKAALSYSLMGEHNIKSN